MKKLLIFIIVYATIGGLIYTWAVMTEGISPFISFALFIIYGVLGGILGAKLEKRGWFIN